MRIINNFHKTIIFVVFLSIISISGCKKHTVRDVFGLQKSTPDEFMVLAREDLKIPTDFNLIEPQATNNLFASDKIKNQARDVIFTKDNNISPNNKIFDKSETMLLNKIGKKDPEIRQKIEQESASEKKTLQYKLKSMWGLLDK